MSITKVWNIHKLASHLAYCEKIVLCHGCFDLLHIGHIKHLQLAKEYGDILVVTITPDEFVNKGPNRPLFAQSLRAEAIAALECVNAVAINEWATAVEPIKLLKPDFFAKGYEYKGNLTDALRQEEEAMTSVYGKLVFTNNQITSSSSELMRKVMTC